MPSTGTHPRTAATVRPAFAAAVVTIVLSLATTGQAAEPASAAGDARPATKAATTPATGTHIPRRSTDLEERVDVWAGGVGDATSTAAETADAALPALPVVEDEAR